MPQVGHRLHASLQRFLLLTVDREHTDAPEDGDQRESGVLGAYHHQVVLAKVPSDPAGKGVCGGVLLADSGGVLDLPVSGEIDAEFVLVWVAAEEARALLVHRFLE
jgi:hypothetical protein